MATWKLGRVVSASACALLASTLWLGCGSRTHSAKRDSSVTGDGDSDDSGDGDSFGHNFGDGDVGDGDVDDGDGGDGDGREPGPGFNWEDLFGPAPDAGNPFNMGMGSACEADLPSMVRCGRQRCETPGTGLAGLVCLVACCTADDTCGTRRATLDNPTECTAEAMPDPTCPAYESGFSTLAGCCAPSGRCGVISGIDSTCITSSGLLPELSPGPACGMMSEDMPAMDAGEPPMDQQDAGAQDAGAMDAAAMDATIPDAGTQDAGAQDAGEPEPDAAMDDDDAGIE